MLRNLFGERPHRRAVRAIIHPHISPPRAGGRLPREARPPTGVSRLPSDMGETRAVWHVLPGTRVTAGSWRASTATFVFGARATTVLPSVPC